MRAAFLTRGPTTPVVAATDKLAKRVALDTAFSIGFDRAVDAASVAKAVRLDPAVPGKLTVESDVDGLPRYVFTPSKALKANTRYTLIVDGVTDRDGVPVERIAMAVRTSVAPAVVRFRPAARTQDVARPTDISVRFSQKMDRASTKRAFKVLVAGKPIKGKITFAENSTVLVFDPAKSFAYDTRVVATVARSARSADGVPLKSAEQVAFRTELKPEARQATSSPAPSGGSSGGGGGGGSVGGGSWASVERYYLGLMNCTRTGGWVTSSGGCSSPGGRNVAALRLDSGISSKVSRPYAKKLAVGADCSHFIGGNPGDRLRRAGYTSYRWAENLGCRSGNPRGAVLGSHLFFQSEKSYNGGHYVNMMNSQYDRAGHRRLGFRRARPARHRLLPPLDGTIGPLQKGVAAAHHAVMIRNVVLHLNNEQPVVVDLFELPNAIDLGVRCTNMKTLDGKRPVFIDDINAVFFFPYLHVRFVEIPPRSLVGTELEVAVEVAVPVAAPAEESLDDDENLEIDEDFLRRIREV